jgi:uncharacterized protein YrrD
MKERDFMKADLKSEVNADVRADINAMNLLDMPVFSINEAAEIGQVKDIIIDPVEKCLLALAVDKRGWYHDVRVIPAGKIRSIGEDTINIDEKQSATRAVNLPKIVEYMHHPYELVGSKIISDDGHSLGRVERYYVERASGAVSRIEVSGGIFSRIWSGRVFIPAEYVMTIGEAAVVVDRACLKNLQVTAGILRVNFQSAADKAADVWQAAQVQSNKFLGSAKRRLGELEEVGRRRLQKQDEAEDLPVNL